MSKKEIKVFFVKNFMPEWSIAFLYFSMQSFMEFHFSIYEYC